MSCKQKLQLKTIYIDIFFYFFGKKKLCQSCNTFCSESYTFFILFFGVAGSFWIWIRDRKVNHRTYDPIKWKRIYRFLFESNSSFPNAAYNSLLYCHFQACFFPILSYHNKRLENHFDGKKEKKKMLRNLSNSRSFSNLLPHNFEQA